MSKQTDGYDWDGYDWDKAAPQFAALASEDLTAEGVGGWLERWSELEKDLGEAGARASRAKSEDTQDADGRGRLPALCPGSHSKMDRRRPGAQNQTLGRAGL